MLRKVLFPALSEPFAYFLGFLLGDGAVGALSNPYIKVDGDFDERNYYDIVIVPLIGKLFGVRVRPRVKKGQLAYEATFSRKLLIEYLESRVGFPVLGKAKSILKTVREAGSKIKRAFLCGLFDADGTMVFSLKSYGSYCYPTVEIKSIDSAIVDTAKEMLVELGFRASVRKSAESWVVSINGVSQLDKWMKTIGSHNIKHLSKYLLWKEHGSCPPYTKVPERLKALHLTYDDFYSELETRTGIKALSLLSSP